MCVAQATFVQSTEPIVPSQLFSINHADLRPQGHPLGPVHDIRNKGRRAASPAATTPIPLPRASLSFLVKQPGSTARGTRLQTQTVDWSRLSLHSIQKCSNVQVFCFLARGTAGRDAGIARGVVVRAPHSGTSIHLS